MMLLICTMTIVFRLLCIVPAAYGNDRRDTNQEDPEPVTYYVPVIAADRPGRRLVNNGVDYFNNSVRRRRNEVGNLTGSNDGVVLALTASDIPLRRDRRRLLTYGETEMTTSAEERPKPSKRDMGSTALCLVVACLALMAVLLCLAIAALWLRGRYRARDKALYTTLSASDPDLPTPATSSTRGRWHLSGEGPFWNTTVGTARWSRKVSKNSTSAPVFRNAKATGCSLDKKRNWPLRSLTGSDQPSATLTESTEAKRTPSPAIITGTTEGRKLLRVKSTEATLPLRSYSVSRTDTADRKPASDHRSEHDESGKQRSGRGSGKSRKRRVDPSGHHNAVLGSHIADSAPDVSVPTSATSTFKGVDLSEDYHQYSYSDDVRLAPDVSPVPLPTIIHRSVTKTIRRWRTRGAAAVASLWTERSSAEPLVEGRRGAVPLPLSARRGWLQQLSLGSISINKPEEDRIDTMADVTPWTQLLALCTEHKPIKFRQIIPLNSEVTAVRSTGGGGQLFCLGSGPAEERLVRVLRLRPQDVHWHTTRLTLARELCGLRENAQNRTSAFFLDARTSLVHDAYPKLLWDARHSHREGPAASDSITPEDLQQPAHYLVTEMQSGWRPLTSYKFPGPAQAVSILEQACWAIAVAESALEFEHRLPVVDAVLVRPTRSPRVEFTLRGRLERVSSAGYKIRLQGLQMARMTIDASPEYTELSRHREFIVGEEERHVFGKMASLLSPASLFKPLTNVIWLQHLGHWLSQQSAKTTTALVPWLRVLTVATSAQDVAEETAVVTDNVAAGRRPLHLMRRRPKQPKQPKQPKLPKQKAPRPAEKSGGTDHPSANGSSQQRQSSGADDLA